MPRHGMLRSPNASHAAICNILTIFWHSSVLLSCLFPMQVQTSRTIYIYIYIRTYVYIYIRIYTVYMYVNMCSIYGCIYIYTHDYTWCYMKQIWWRLRKELFWIDGLCARFAKRRLESDDNFGRCRFNRHISVYLAMKQPIQHPR